MPGPTAASVQGLRCSYCGSPLRVGPDTVLVVCPYCGKPNWVKGEPGSVLAARPPGMDRAWEAFMELARRDPGLRGLGVEPARIETVLVPFYEARGRLYSRYEASGFLIVTVSRRRGDRVYTETRTVPFHVSGVYERGFEALVGGKRSLGEEAVDELAEHYLSTRPELVDLGSVEWRKGEYTALAADYGPKEAEEAVRDDACDWLRERVEAEIRRRARASYHGPGAVTAVNVVSKTITCEFPELEVRGPVLLPLTKVFYVCEGRVYRAYFSGWDMYPLLREEPMTGGQRGFFLVLAGLLGGGSGGAAAALYAAAGGGAGGLAVAGAMLGLGAALGYLVARAGLSEARVEKGHGGSRLRSMFTTIAAHAERLAGRRPLGLRRLRCPYCGAVFEAPKGAVYAVCPYCGTTLIARTGEEAPKQYYYPPRLSDGEAFLLAVSRARMLPGAPTDIAEAASLARSELHYLPLYVCTAEAWVEGCEGAREEREETWLATSRPPLPGLRHSYRFPALGREPYDPRRARRGVFHQPDASPEPGCSALRARVEYRAAGEARLAGCGDGVESRAVLVGVAHYPVWLIEYRHPLARQPLRAVVDAVDANLLYLEYPIPLERRALVLGGAAPVLGAGLVAAAAVGLAAGPLAASILGGLAGSAMAASPLLATGLSRTGRYSYRPPRVERLFVRG